MTQECAEYRALYEMVVLPPNMGPRVDWARVLDQKQVRGQPQRRRRLRELQVTPRSNQSHTECHQGPHSMCGPGGGQGAGKGRRRRQCSQGKLPARGGSEASRRWKGLAVLGRSGEERTLRHLPEEAWGRVGGGVLQAGRQNQLRALTLSEGLCFDATPKAMKGQWRGHGQGLASPGS